MNRHITRRDFLNGVAVTLGASLFPYCSEKPVAETFYAPEQAPGYYPPALAGLRGDHKGSFEVAHELRDDSFWKKAGPIKDTGEEYDLVIVGGGISGLSAAYYFQKHAGPNARILILENHDDFGGHAKRNEFSVDGRTLQGFGGTFSIDSPAPYSAIAKEMIQELGIDMNRWKNVVDWDIYISQGLAPAVFFDKETFQSDRLAPFPLRGFWDDSDEAGRDPKNWKPFLAEAPFNDQARRDIVRLYTSNVDYMRGLTSEEKKAKLARMSYSDFLTTVVKVDPDVVKFFQARPHGLYGTGIDALPAQDAWGLGFPGFEGMRLDPSFGKGMNLDAMEYPDGGEAYFFHFPDGNAAIARMLVRKLIPASIPGNTMDDIVTARCNYAQLDQPASNVRIRLNSSVVRVQHQGNSPSASQIEVAYVRDNKLLSVKGKHCILACWNTMIPYICPELPEKQKEDLAFGVKVPIIYTNAVISNWNSLVKAGTGMIYCPGSYFSFVNLDMPVSIGNYKCTRHPDEAIVLHLMRTPCNPGLSARQQHRAGRLELYTTSFGTFERNIREQLNRILGSYGFDSARDIKGITVNRWAHGYAYQYNSLFDSFWLDGEETPCERARKPFGRISIANADAAAYSYTDAAIDQAYRAVNEVLNR